MIDVKSFPLVSDQIEYPELTVIIRELSRTLDRGIMGDVVELGCYSGTTSLFIQRQLIDSGSDNILHLYDSFEGLPAKHQNDSSPAGEQFVAGELSTTKQAVIKNFKRAQLPVPRIHRVWFEQMNDQDLPSQICFAFLDGDFYSSIKCSLEVITPLLAAGAVIIVDDYQSESLPGAQKATDEWCVSHGLSARPEQSLAVINWPG